MNTLKKIAFCAMLAIGAGIPTVTMTSCSKEESVDEREKFVGNYAVVDALGGSFSTSISKGTAATDIVIGNLGNFTTPAAVTASVSGSNIVISNFTDAQGRKFTGSGTITTSGTVSVIAITYTVTYTDNTTETATATMTKQ